MILKKAEQYWKGNLIEQQAMQLWEQCLLGSDTYEMVMMYLYLRWYFSSDNDKPS